VVYCVFAVVTRSQHDMYVELFVVCVSDSSVVNKVNLVHYRCCIVSFACWKSAEVLAGHNQLCLMFCDCL